MTKKVLVLGGGVAGLTVAHECREAGAEVIICEKDARWGGKVLAYRLGADSVAPGAPVEHSLRTFHSSYFSLFETMRRIPLGAGTPFDAITPVRALTLIDGADVSRMARVDTDLRQPPHRRARALWRAMGAFGVPWRDSLSWFGTIGAYILSGKTRRRRIAARRVDDLLDFDRRSEAFRTFILSLVDIIFGAKRDASAAVVVDMFARLALVRLGTVDPLRFMTNTANGPVNECFIDPWVTHLKAMGVEMREGAAAAEVEWEGSGETHAPIAVRLSDGERIEADAFVFAVSPAAMASLLPEFYAKSVLPEMRRTWSAGAQFFCRRFPETLGPRDSFSLVVGSAWSIIYLIETPSLWRNVAMPDEIEGVLSVTVSSFDTPGVLYGKTFWQCSWEEAQNEILAQIGFADSGAIVGAHLDTHLRRIRSEEYLEGSDGIYHGWEISPEYDGHVWVFATPLWIFSPESGVDGIVAKTSIPRLFVAGEFSATSTKQPTMEKANQAGKLCAAAVLAELGLPYDRRRVERPLSGRLARWLYP